MTHSHPEDVINGFCRYPNCGYEEEPMEETKKINDGGPAFPIVWQSAVTGNDEVIEGMTLRDYFAGQALPIIIDHDIKQSGAWDDHARQAYEMADAMIKERSKPERS